jgi:hypothetical protein
MKLTIEIYIFFYIYIFRKLTYDFGYFLLKENYKTLTLAHKHTLRYLQEIFLFHHILLNRNKFSNVSLSKLILRYLYNY